MDFGRAVAAALFNDPEKARFTPVAFKEAFTALQSGEIDILSRNTTRTYQRDTKLGLEFVGTIFYDGQGFMVKKSLGVKSAAELNGASVCTQAGTTTELNLSDYFVSKGMTFKPVVYESADEATVIYDSGRCDVYTTDTSGLAARRSTLGNPKDHRIIKHVGNYGEMYERNVGPATALGLERGVNALWTNGGLMYAPPIR